MRSRKQLRALFGTTIRWLTGARDADLPAVTGIRVKVEETLTPEMFNELALDRIDRLEGIFAGKSRERRRLQQNERD